MGFYNSERFEPRWVNVVVWVIVRVCSVVLRRTVVGVDWRFDNLSGNHHHSDDGFHSGCRNVSQHQQQSFSGLHYKPWTRNKNLCVVVWVIVRVCSVVLRRTVVGVDWRFGNLSGNHHHSDDGFHSGCRNVSQHQQQSFSGLHYKPGRSLKPQHMGFCFLFKENDIFLELERWTEMTSWDVRSSTNSPSSLWPTASWSRPYRFPTMR